MIILSNRKQRIKVENVFSKWQNIETGVPQGSIFGPVLFNIHICLWLVLILDNTYFASYADDNTPYTINQNTDLVTKSLEELSIPILSCFKENKIKLNLDKCRFIVSGVENAKIKLDDFNITNSKKEKLLAIISDDGLKFQYHIENLCEKVSFKLRVLSRLAPFVDLPQKNILLFLRFISFYFLNSAFYSIYYFFSHSLATTLCFGCAIAECSITK